MPVSTLTSKGQITVPLAVRQALGLRTGTKVDFVPLADGFKVVALHGAEPQSLKGRFAGRVAKAVSIAQMDEAISAEAALRGSARAKRPA